MVLGRRNVGDSSTDCATARSLNWLLIAIALAVVADAFKHARRFTRTFWDFVWVMALSLGVPLWDSTTHAQADAPHQQWSFDHAISGRRRCRYEQGGLLANGGM